MHVRIISSDTFRRVYCEEKNPIGSKRWLKTWRNWNLQPHNIASLYKRAMPQSPAAAIVWFETAKSKNTKQSNQKTNMNKTAFCGVEYSYCMHDIWGLFNLTPQRYLTHERLSHNLYRCLLHLRDRRNLLPFSDVVGASIKSIPTKYHTLGTTFTGCKTSQAFTSSTFLWHR